MLAYCTYCSANKSRAPESLPAVERYQSSRIDAVLAAAGRDQLGFYILSGEHGLLRANDPIDYYDHLLAAGEVDAHARVVARQLCELGVTEIVYFSAPLADDKQLVPYYDAIRLACCLSEIRFRLIEIDPQAFAQATLHTESSPGRPAPPGRI